MKFLDKRYIIGIDLGTTNSAVSYADLESEQTKEIRLFQVPQMTAAGEFAARPVLPSFLYIPGDYDLSKDAVSIPWDREDDTFVGAFARDHGSSVPARLVSSAKSWLCHAKADRKAKILPWGAGEEVSKISPVSATAAYLRHIRRSWNHACGDNADLYLENQVVIITVPASFDEVARDLTMEAATHAGLSNVTLLEEPLAAFYNWLIRHEKSWDQHVAPNELILVCDVGGGTTDFTLITLQEAEGSPRFERIAVGDHLLLGGDNIDLALARLVEGAFSNKKSSLSTDRWKALTHQCREAKEVILDGKADSRKITLMGKGKKLIADTLSATLDRETVEKTVIDGFFPLADPDTPKKADIRKGITEFGLPYEPEPAITRHLGWFLNRHQKDVAALLGRERPEPDLILFNGGSLKSPVIQERIRGAVRHWFGQSDTALPRVLENREPDLSVALGAAYYGLVKMGQGVRVGSGSPRAYYMGAEAEVEAGKAEKVAICLVERGLDEGSHIELTDKKFEVIANRPVVFDMFSSSFRSGDRCGDIIEIDETLTPLPPLQTVVQFGKKGAETSIPVHVEADYTEVGTLALWCRSAVTDHRWRLQFQIRDTASQTDTGVMEEDTFDESLVEAACSLVREAFADPGHEKRLQGLVKEITAIVERPKERWPLGLIRRISDELLKQIEKRGTTPISESRWLNLTGFCLRPGFGEGFDEHRMKRLWRIYRNGPVHSGNPQVRSEWWILWRRAAGGLAPGQQRQIIQDLTPVLLPKKGQKTKKVPPQERLEIWMAAANMELLLTKDKIKLGKELLSEISKKSKPQHFWSLSRFGARELLYGPVDRVVPPAEAEKWIEGLMEIGPEIAGPAAKSLGSGIAQMARKTGDRIRDLSPEFAAQVADWMREQGYPEEEIRVIEKVIPLARQEESAIFGESLPSGIVLRS